MIDPAQDAEPLADELHEQLVAYLDGELPDNESRAVESRLASDTETREALRGMDQVWNALDLLPSQQTTHHFTQSTVAMVSAAAVEEAARVSAALPAQRRYRRWISGMVLLLLACSGFVLARAVTNRQDRLLLTNLPELMHASVLSQFGDVEFLEAWSKQAKETFASGRTEDVIAEGAEWGQLMAASPLDRHDWAEDLAPERLAELGEQAQAFQAMLPAKQEQLHRLSDALQASPDADRLRENALIYHRLVSQLPSTAQAILRDMPTDERLKRLRKEMPRLNQAALLRLSEDERRRFRGTLERVAQETAAQGLGARFRGDPMKKLWLAVNFVSRDRASDRLEGTPLAEMIRNRWEEIQSELLLGLPTRVAGLVQQQPNPQRQAKALRALITQTLNDASLTDTSKYFAEELTKQRQLELLMLPTEAMEQRLQDLASDGELGPLPGRRPGPPPHGGPPGWHPPPRHGPPHPRRR